jgi:hypothetical protein
MRCARTLQQSDMLIIIIVDIIVIISIMFTICKVNQVSAVVEWKEYPLLVSDHLIFCLAQQYMCQWKDFMEMVSVGFSNFFK